MADESLMEKWANRNTNRILKLNMAIEHFMTSSNTAPRVARRFTYAIRGMYSVINKLNVATLTAGKALEGLQGFFTNPEASKGIKIFSGALSKMSKTLGPKAVVGMALGAGKGASNLRKGSDAHLGKWSTVGTRRQRIIDSIKERAKQNRKGAILKEAFGNGAKRFRNFFTKNNWTRFINGIGTFVKLSVKMMFLAIFYITTIALAISLVYPVLKDGFMNMWQGIKESAVWIGEALGLVWEGVSDIFGFLFGDKTFNEMIDGVLKIAFGLLWTAWAVIWGVVKAVWDLTTGIFMSMVDKIWTWIKGAWDKGWLAFSKVLIPLIVGFVAFVLGFPVLLPALLLIVGWKLVKWAVDKLNPIKAIKSAIGFRATGGMASGLTVVGERGPELVNLPRGSRVHSNAESRRMVGSGGINITINAHSLQDTELRRIAQKVGDMINRQVNRGTSSSTVR